MKKIILVGMIILILSAFMSLNAQWAKTYGGSSMDIPYSICQTYDGKFIVAGRTQSFGTGTTDFWILKLFKNGDIEWQKIYGVSSHDIAYSIQQTNDGGYIVAGSTSSFGAEYTTNIWILKLFKNGDIEWQKIYGVSSSDSACSIQQTNDGGYIVAGSTSSFGAGEADIWILKLSPDGDIEWQRTYGGSDYDYAQSIQQTIDDGFIVAGDTGRYPGSDIWILKLSSEGDIEWQKTYRADENDSDNANSIQQTINGGYIVAGSHSSFGTIGKDFWILKLSPDGDIEWQRTYGGGYPDIAKSIQQTMDGRYIVTGETESFGDSNYQDFWVFKLSSNGELHSYCDLIKGSTDVVITDTDISLEDTKITPQDTNIEPQETNISPSDTSATVYNFCSGKYILRIKVYDGGTTDPLPGSHYYDPGIKVSIKAITTSENIFRGWGGDASGNDNPITITMDSHKSISASFSAEWGNGGGGGWDIGPSCFIATAAYSSQLHPHVKILRNFRDKYLMPYKFGRMLVDFYYKYSPFVANLITKHKLLKIPAQINLLPLVAFSYSMLHFGPIITAIMFIFIFTSPFFFVLFYRRKLRSCWIRIRQRK